LSHSSITLGRHTATTTTTTTTTTAMAHTVQAAVATGALVPSPGVPSGYVRLGMRRAVVLSVLMRASRLALVIVT
jgi:hypothetical protein